MQASGTLFLAVKLGGAAYLVYLGIELLRTRSADLTLEGGGGARSGGSLVVQGLASNVANPKIAVFFMAFMPQFAPTGTTHPGWMLLTLGAGFAGLTFLVKGTVGLAAGTFSIWLRARPRWIVAMHRISGVVLIALGLRLAAQSRT